MQAEKFFDVLKGTQRLNLHGWISLQIKKEEISQSGDIALVDKIFEFIHQGISLPLEEYEMLPWYFIGEAFQFIDRLNSPSKDFPFLRPSEERPQETVINWDYPGRTWYVWFNTFAKKFGWTKETIADLDIDDACGLMQEIVIDEQMEKEFLHSLSEISYPYNPSTKKVCINLCLALVGCYLYSKKLL